MELNKIYHGFRLLKTTKIKEVNSTAYEFTHEKSGARLLFLENKDDNKVFSISFRTPPKDDTGVAHIVEHSTLCGSRKFPLKEPFVELVKGSLNTFLNAMTYPDKTMYPVASQNDKDFQNLMDVYLDAVFYPVMYTTPEVLMQEGWHYEIEKPADDLEYSGVVYNEMKGALSSPEDILDSKSMNSLFPDTTYGFESGGDPEAIPQLTQQMFIDFHEKYYHPSNSYIYLYGDMDIDEKLAFLDKEYLQSFSRIAVPSKIMKQPQFKEHKVIYGEYPIGAEEAAEDKTFLSLNAIVGEATEVETMLALEILEHALLKTQAAPLRKALIDAKIGKDVQSSFEDGILQPFFSIIINGAEADRAEKFRTVVRDTLQKLVQDGIDRELMEASINLLEFKLREADFGQYPKGLVYNIKIMNSWLYDKDPTIFLYYEELMQKMKDGLENGYFEKVLKERFLDNPHMTLLVLSPNKELAAEKAAALQKVLAIKKEQLSTGELDHIIEMTAALKQRQQREDSPEA
ncbi:MAG: insulinase family protein, partial [Selenomonadaceae bacterium]